MRSGIHRVVSTIQLVCELCIAAGFLLGIIPFIFWISGSWVLPLVIVSFIFSIVLVNGTTLLSGINIVIAFLTLIPFVNIFTGIVGVLVSLSNIAIIRRQLRNRS